MLIFIYDLLINILFDKKLTWVLSSVVEHLTADQEVIGSIPIVPFNFLFWIKQTNK